MLLSQLRSLAIEIPAPTTTVAKLAANLRHRMDMKAKRNEVVALMDAPDFVLTDIGVTRGDVLEALRARDADAGHCLRVLAARRRFATKQRAPL